MNTIISFITPVYNNTKYLRAAIDSIMNQVDDDTLIEVIIVDDGSTDDTPRLVDEIAMTDPRITAIHQKNQWIYASFNNGIKVSSGEYFYILNSDDLLIDGSVKLLLDNIEKYDHPDVIWTKVLWQNVDDEQNVLDGYDMNELAKEDDFVSSKDLVHEKWHFLQLSRLIGNQANLYKKSLWHDHNFRNEYYAGDALFNTAIADDISSMLILSAPVYRYLSYGKSGLNASVGKCYGYEHEMFNEMMDEELSLLEKWGIEGAPVEYVIYRRLRNLTYEIEQFAFDTCKLSDEEKITRIFSSLAETRLRSLFSSIGKEREYESRILTGTKKLLNKLPGNVYVPEFVSTLIQYLPENHLDNVDESSVDLEMITEAIHDPGNKDEVGKVYYFTKWND